MRWRSCRPSRGNSIRRKRWISFNRYRTRRVFMNSLKFSPVIRQRKRKSFRCLVCCRFSVGTKRKKKRKIDKKKEKNQSKMDTNRQEQSFAKRFRSMSPSNSSSPDGSGNNHNNESAVNNRLSKGRVFLQSG